MTKEYMMSESQIRDLTGQLRTKDERIAELEEALVRLLTHPGVTHKPTAAEQQDVDHAMVVLGDAPKEGEAIGGE